MVEKEINCPVCDRGINTHMVKTWVIGDKTFELNGSESISTRYPSYFQRYGTRGSSVIILFCTEGCDHMWLEETYFQEGNTFHNTMPLTNEQVLEFHKANADTMWRD